MHKRLLAVTLLLASCASAGRSHGGPTVVAAVADYIQHRYQYPSLRGPVVFVADPSCDVPTFDASVETVTFATLPERLRGDLQTGAFVLCDTAVSGSSASALVQRVLWHRGVENVVIAQAGTMRLRLKRGQWHVVEWKSTYFDYPYADLDLDT